MTDKDSSGQNSFRLSRRKLLSGIAPLGIFSGISLPQALAQKRLISELTTYVGLRVLSRHCREATRSTLMTQN